MSSKRCQRRAEQRKFLDRNLSLYTHTHNHFEHNENIDSGEFCVSLFDVFRNSIVLNFKAEFTDKSSQQWAIQNVSLFSKLAFLAGVWI